MRAQAAAVKGLGFFAVTVIFAYSSVTHFATLFVV